MYRTPSSKFTFICNGLAQNAEVTVLLRKQKPEDVWVVDKAPEAEAGRCMGGGQSSSCEPDSHP